MTDVRFGQYAIYKGLKGTNGAFQFQLNPAHLVEGRVKTGCIFIEAAPAVDKNVYDWQNQKVSFALGVNDIQTLVGSGGDEVKLVHKHKGLTKYFSITPGSRSGYFMKLVASNDQTRESTQVSIPLSVGEATVLRELLLSSVSSIIGWQGIELQ